MFLKCEIFIRFYIFYFGTEFAYYINVMWYLKIIGGFVSKTSDTKYNYVKINSSNSKRSKHRYHG